MKIPEIKLVPANGDPRGAGHHKIGGDPEWIQEPLKLECCGRPMTFYGQFDSVDIPGARLPDSGIIYVFVCFQCWSTEALLQCC